MSAIEASSGSVMSSHEALLGAENNSNVKRGTPIRRLAVFWHLSMPVKIAANAAGKR